MADSTRAARDKNRQPVQRIVRKQAAVSGERRDTETSADLERSIRGQFRGLRSRHHDGFGRRAKRLLLTGRMYPDTFVDPRARNTSADLIDHSGAIISWNDPRNSHLAAAAAPAGAKAGA